MRLNTVGLGFWAFLAIFWLLLPFKSFSLAQRDRPKPRNEIIVWTYDSFVSDWGPGKPIAAAFQKHSGITVKFISQGDAGAMLAKLLVEGDRASADILLGIDNYLAPKALASGLFLPYQPKAAGNIPNELIIDPAFRLTPYDFGHFAIVYDSVRISQPPRSLEDLTQEQWKSKLILMDPRTSTPGLGFFTWVKALYGDNWTDFWRRLQPSILTITEGWDSGYGLFSAGEAPMVLSYTTSPAYHLEYEATERYKAALFDQGHIVQIESLGIIKHSSRQALAQAFVDFMLSDEAQSILPLTNWMYPVGSVALPESFRLTISPPKLLIAEPVLESELDQWTKTLIQATAPTP